MRSHYRSRDGSVAGPLARIVTDLAGRVAQIETVYVDRMILR